MTSSLQFPYKAFVFLVQSRRTNTCSLGGSGYPSWTLFKAVEAQIKSVQQWTPRDFQLPTRV